MSYSDDVRIMNVSKPYYRLELWPTEEGIQYYNNYATNNRSDDNAGVDLYSVDSWTSKDEPHKLLDLGTRARMVLVNTYGETDVHYYVYPRSSIFKSGIMLGNSVGIIDKTYRGPLKAVAVPLMDGPKVEAGTRITQIVAPDMGWIKEIRLVNSLNETSRGTGGFGSTGLTQFIESPLINDKGEVVDPTSAMGIRLLYARRKLQQ
jgi:deoxyuridine 5'-triphosphate nucleotidohydrolase